MPLLSKREPSNLNMKTQNFLKLSWDILYSNAFLILGILSILPFMVGTMFIHPYADDYAFACFAKGNYLNSFFSIYNTWTGRFSSTFFLLLFPFNYPSLLGYRLIALLFIILILFSIYFLVNEVSGKTISIRVKLTLTTGFCFLLFYRMPSISNAIYWLTSSFTNLLPVPFFLIFLTLLLKILKNSIKNNAVLKSLLILLALLLPGFNEPMLVIILCGSWSFLFIKLYKRKLDLFSLIITLTITISSLISFLAPGNFLRSQSEFSIPYTEFPSLFLVSLLNSIKYGLLFLMSWFNSPLFIVTVFFLPIYVLIIRKNYQLFSSIFSPPAFILAGLTLSIYFLSFLPSSLISQSMPIQRTQNTIYFYLYFIWFYNIGLIIYRLISRGHKNLNFNLPLLPKIILFCFILISLKNTNSNQNNIGYIYTDIITGKASEFNRINQLRYNMLLESKDPVIFLPPIKLLPKSIYSGCDLTEDYTDPQNEYLLNYYKRQHSVIPNKVYVRSKLSVEK